MLAKQPLHLTPDQIRFLAIASTMMIVVGGFIASAISDHYSRKTIMLIGVAGITFVTLLLTLVQTGEQLIVVRLSTGLAGGFAVFAPFPIAAELMPARHRPPLPPSMRWRWRARSRCSRSSAFCSPAIRTPSG